MTDRRTDGQIASSSNSGLPDSYMHAKMNIEMIKWLSIQTRGYGRQNIDCADSVNVFHTQAAVTWSPIVVEFRRLCREQWPSKDRDSRDRVILTAQSIFCKFAMVERFSFWRVLFIHCLCVCVYVYSDDRQFQFNTEQLQRRQHLRYVMRCQYSGVVKLSYSKNCARPVESMKFLP